MSIGSAHRLHLSYRRWQSPYLQKYQYLEPGVHLTFDLISDWSNGLKYGIKRVPDIVLG